LAVFGSHHFEKCFAVFLDFWRSGFDDHSVRGFGGARGNWVADSFDLDDTETATAEGVETVVIAESGDVFFETFGDFVNGFALCEGGGLPIDGDGELGGDGGIWVVDHRELEFLSLKIARRKGRRVEYFLRRGVRDKFFETERKICFSDTGGCDV